MSGAIILTTTSLLILLARVASTAFTVIRYSPASPVTVYAVSVCASPVTTPFTYTRYPVAPDTGAHVTSLLVTCITGGNNTSVSLNPIESYEVSAVALILIVTVCPSYADKSYTYSLPFAMHVTATPFIVTSVCALAFILRLFMPSGIVTLFSKYPPALLEKYPFVPSQTYPHAFSNLQSSPISDLLHALFVLTCSASIA